MSFQKLLHKEARMPGRERLMGGFTHRFAMQTKQVNFAVLDYRPTGNLIGISMR